MECIIQEDYMNEHAREEFLNRFTGNEDCDLNAMIHMDIEMEEEKSLVGFCVLGGIFSEGIDLKNDSLDRSNHYRDRTAAGLQRAGDFKAVF